MATIGSAIIGVLAALPKLLDLVEKAVGVISQWVEEAKHRRAVADAQDAAAKAQATKDTSDLEKILDPDKSTSNSPSNGVPK